MATVGVGAILVSSTQQLAELLRVRDWDAVQSALSEDGDQALIDEANQFASADVPVPVLELGGACRLRAVLVIAVDQAMIFLPLALFAGLICWGISGLAVPAEVAAEWIYGDNATKGQIADVKGPGLFAEPWPRVALRAGRLLLHAPDGDDPDRRRAAQGVPRTWGARNPTVDRAPARASRDHG